MSNKIGIVILNYLNFEDTIDCLKSLKKQTTKNFEVVIVDNGSNNESVKNIEDEIGSIENFHLVKSINNLGYAKGNNLGIKFLIDKFGINKILIINNDVLFIEKDYIYHLSNIVYSSKVGAIGTKIIGSDGLNQNPAKWDYSFEAIQKNIQNYENRISGLKATDSLKNVLLRTKVGKWLQSIKRKNRKLVSDSSKYERILDKNELLHGSVIMLTENYFSKFKGFYPDTFLYGEEMILKILFNKSNLKMLYYPQLTILHKEDQSSAMSFNNEKAIMNKYQYESNKIIMTLYDKTEIEILEAFNKSDITHQYEKNITF